MPIVKYDSNNSGGNWWLTDENWFALEDAGWVVHWIHPIEDDHEGAVNRDDENDPHTSTWGLGHTHSYGPALLLPAPRPSPDLPIEDRYLGALAKSAAKEFESPRLAVWEWEKITGLDASDEGCNCCGNPHDFEWTDEDGKTHYTHIAVSTSLRFD